MEAIPIGICCTPTTQTEPYYTSISILKTGNGEPENIVTLANELKIFDKRIEIGKHFPLNDSSLSEESMEDTTFSANDECKNTVMPENILKLSDQPIELDKPSTANISDLSKELFECTIEGSWKVPRKSFENKPSGRQILQRKYRKILRSENDPLRLELFKGSPAQKSYFNKEGKSPEYGISSRSTISSNLFTTGCSEVENCETNSGSRLFAEVSSRSTAFKSPKTKTYLTEFKDCNWNNPGKELDEKREISCNGSFTNNFSDNDDNVTQFGSGRILGRILRNSTKKSPNTKNFKSTSTKKNLRSFKQSSRANIEPRPKKERVESYLKEFKGVDVVDVKTRRGSPKSLAIGREFCLLKYLDKLKEVANRSPFTKRAKEFAERDPSEIEFDFDDYYRKMLTIKNRKMSTIKNRKMSTIKNRKMSQVKNRDLE